MKSQILLENWVFLCFTFFSTTSLSKEILFSWIIWKYNVGKCEFSFSLNRKLNKSKYIKSPHNIENLQENYYILFCHKIINYCLCNFKLVVPIFNLKSSADFKTFQQNTNNIYFWITYIKVRKSILMLSAMSHHDSVICYGFQSHFIAEKIELLRWHSAREHKTSKFLSWYRGLKQLIRTCI